VCGIAGMWGTSDDIVVRQMMDSLVHRGPDDEGTYSAVDSSGMLGHRRLSIMDPCGGRQPIERIGEDCAIIANGEIYNFPQLRVDLSNRHRFRTRSDSESVLHLYREAGVDSAKQLDGMFAFAIADGEELYLARDPLGIKPLYYGQRDQGLVFASELKALVGHAGAIVLEQLNTETGEVDARQVIDGQQRLTTLQLVIAGIRDICQAKGSANYQEAFKRLSENYDPSGKNAESIFKVWSTNVDREHFRQTMTAGAIDALAESCWTSYGPKRKTGDSSVFPARRWATCLKRRCKGQSPSRPLRVAPRPSGRISRSDYSKSGDTSATTTTCWSETSRVTT